MAKTLNGWLPTIAILTVSVPVTAQQIDNAAATLNAISITSPSFHVEKSSLLKQKVMSFNVKNGSKVVVKTLSFHAKLQTPGRTLPWIESDQNYDFPGGLEPGETRHLDLAPNMFGEWGKAEDEWIKTGVLSINVVAIDDAGGNKIESNPTTAK